MYMGNLKPYDRMVKARLDLLQTQPFWGALSLYLKIVEDPTCETLWTDGVSVGFNPEYITTLSDLELQGAWVHEVFHVGNKHHIRRGNREPGLWNEATDHSINPLIIRAGFKLPGGVLNDPRFHGMAAEEIYAILFREQAQQQQPEPEPEEGEGEGDEQPQSGPGSPGDDSEGDDEGEGDEGGEEGADEGPAGGDEGDPADEGDAEEEGADGADEAPEGPPQKKGGDPGKCGEVRDMPNAQDENAKAAEEREVERRITSVMNAEAARLAGVIPGDVKAFVEAVRKPVIDWRESLHRFINEKTRVDYSWTRPNKRLLGAGYIVPGMIPDGINQLVAMCDSSGSIYSNQKYLDMFQAELASALESGMIGSLVVVWCDTRVTGVQEFLLGDKVKLDPKGGGGTAFSPALEFVAREYPDAAALLYFTDLECEDFGTEPYVPLMWIAYGFRHELEKLAAKVPFGEVVIMGEGR